jgi:sialic acid synthase SpsE/mannose-6-phosphate isomerase-like protein (cupin superfamily)
MKIPKKFFVLEMANNHMGDVKHGLKIIDEFYKVTKKFPFKFGFKLQYRDLNTFIHKDLKHRNDIKYIKRFNETKLTKKDFRSLILKMRKRNFIPICTPFDEASVDNIVKDNFDIIKVASCSFNDWPLLEKISKTNKPIIASTAGATLEEIGRVVNFFRNRNKEFALMHCVAEYPTPSNKLNLNRLKFLVNKFPKINIGYSTHEDPADSNILPIAITMGANIFEKHVGYETEKYPLNRYSSSPLQVNRWLKAATETYKKIGDENKIFNKNENEINSLTSLKRGVFLKKSIKANKKIEINDVYFAFPPQKNQITTDKFSKYSHFLTTKNISKDGALTKANSKVNNTRKIIENIVETTKKLLKKSNQFLKGQYDFEISHHYGLEKFFKYGLVMLTILNREYCKKILIILPGQTHPEQWHVKKEETFHILYGIINLKLNGKSKEYGAGSLITIKPKTKHEFSSKLGSVIEEISTTHFKKDSFYTDKKIMKNSNRKISITYHWES